MNVHGCYVVSFVKLAKGKFSKLRKFVDGTKSKLGSKSSVNDKKEDDKEEEKKEDNDIAINPWK